jgi:hypothetical protein
MKALELNIRISKKALAKIAVFAALVAVAVIFDAYFESHPVEMNEMEETADTSTKFGVVYLYNPVNSCSAKTSLQKTPSRKLFEHSHNKHIQQYHQVRNYQVLKAESKRPNTPLIFLYHHLTFNHYYFSFPDDDPLLS